MTGTEESFEDAFDELFARAFRLARRIVGDAAAAEDIAAEALARAYARWSRVGSLPWRDGWVLRVASNLAIDVLRRQSAAAAQPEPPSVFVRAEDEVIALRLALAAALPRLPKRQRQAVTLRYLAGLTDNEVAEALGISAGSVKTHVHRGLAALRGRLGPGFEEVVPVGLD